MAVNGCPKKAVQSPTPIGGLDFLDMDRVLKYPEIQVLDFLDTPSAPVLSMRSAHKKFSARPARTSAYVKKGILLQCLSPVSHQAKPSAAQQGAKRGAETAASIPRHGAAKHVAITVRKSLPR